MKGVHEDEVGSTWWYARYRRGSIVRHREAWGIVTRAEHEYNQRLFIIWLAKDGYWYAGEPLTEMNGFSAAYSHNDPSIPDRVLAKATEIMLT